MSEGGIFPWRVQKIQLPKSGRPGNYANLSRPLPDPPKDQIWVQDANTREWKLMPLAVATAATAVDDDDDDDDDAVAAVEEEEEERNDGTLIRPVLLPATTATESFLATNDDHDDDDGITTAVPIPLPALEVAIPINRNINTHARNEALSSDNDGIRYHEVQATDTFQGICLRYRVTPTELRRANKMILMDSNLTLHTKLVVPSSTVTTRTSPTNNNNEKKKQQAEAEKIAALLSKISIFRPSSQGSFSHKANTKVTYSEARAYLEIEDWDVNRAMESVCEDFGWSTSST